MALTRDFRDTIRERARRDAGFRRALLQEAVEQMLAGDVGLSKTMIRNYINATVGFPALAETVHTPSESLMRMFSAKGQSLNVESVRRHCSAAKSGRSSFQS